MPAFTSSKPQPNGVTRLTNCLLVRGDDLISEDLWVSSVTGKILEPQLSFYGEQLNPYETIDLESCILSPGLIDVQLNGAYGFNFSAEPKDASVYVKGLRSLNRQLVQTGVTSYLPTLTSQTREIYHKVLPHLGPSGELRLPEDGAESLGAHVEGPFINARRNGVHNKEGLSRADEIADLEAMYGAENLRPSLSLCRSTPIKKITLAPEMDNNVQLIPWLVARGIICAIGHSEATYEQATAAVAAGANMITHLFNAMGPIHHRDPGIFGVLATADGSSSSSSFTRRRPYFGLIADGQHLHPTTVKFASSTHPQGLILVTDAMHVVGLQDGQYEWTNGGEEQLVNKRGAVVEAVSTGTIAGSSITLIECVNNFLQWTGASIPRALRAVTAAPAEMLGLERVKGTLDPGADADFVILSQRMRSVSNERSNTVAEEEPRTQLVVDEVWKFGSKVFSRTDKKASSQVACMSPEEPSSASSASSSSFAKDAT